MRRAALILGILTLALIWVGPPLSAWRDSFAAHMLAHMGVVAIAAPLIAIGISSFSPFTGRRCPEGTDDGPRRHRARLAPPLICLPASSPRERAEDGYVSLPLIASLVELAVVWGWHAPAARLWAENSLPATMLEQATFLVAGLFLWITTLGGRRTPARDAAGAFALLLTSVHMTLLGALLSLAQRPLYGPDNVTCFGLVLGAEEDQALGGVIMLFIGGAVYMVGGVLLLARLLDGKTERLVG